MIEIGHVQELEIDGRGAGRFPVPDAFGDLRRRSAGSESLEVLNRPTDGLRPVRHRVGVFTAADDEGRGVADRGRIAADTLAGRIDPGELLSSIVGGEERGIELIGESGCQGRRPLWATSADDDRRPRTLDGLGQCRAAGHRVVPAVEVEGPALRCLPQTDNQTQLLFEPIESFFEDGKGDGVGAVLVVVPPGSQPKLHSTTAHGVDLGDGDGERSGPTEGGRGDEGSQSDRRCLAGQTGQCRPGVGRSGETVPRTHLQVVVGPEEGIKPLFFAAEGYGQLIVVGGTLLGFDKEAESHPLIMDAAGRRGSIGLRVAGGTGLCQCGADGDIDPSDSRGQTRDVRFLSLMVSALGPDDLVLCSGTLPRGTAFLDRLGAASAAGFGGISLWGRDYGAARHEGYSDADLRTMVDDHGLAVAELDPAWWWTPGAGDVRIPPEADPVEIFRYDEDELLRIAEVFGARSINAADVLGGPWGVEEGAEGFAALCDRAAGHGLLVHLEWLAWSKVADLATALEIVRLADRPNGGLNIDMWHCARTGTTAAQLRALPAQRVLAVQVDDGPAAAETDLVHATLHRRLLPGHGDFDLVGYLGALDEAGVRVPIGVEVFSDELHACGPVSAAAQAAEAMHRLLGEFDG